VAIQAPFRDLPDSEKLEGWAGRRVTFSLSGISRTLSGVSEIVPLFTLIAVFREIMNISSSQFRTQRCRFGNIAKRGVPIQGAKMTLKDVQDLFCGSGQETIDLHFKIVRDIGAHTVALFAVSVPDGFDHLELAGSGTLVTTGDSYWILTAAHVWIEKLKGAKTLGISLRTNTNHHFPMEIDTIAACGLDIPGKWNEWGPDLMLLRIPPVHVGTIEANKSFFYLGPQSRPPLKTDHLETSFLLGCPYGLGTYTQVHADVEIRGFPVNEMGNHIHGGIDYLDVDAYVHDPSTMKSLGGVSGGGLWKVKIFIDHSTGKPDWVLDLEGVAFWGFPIDGTKAIVRCHALESIRSAISRC